VKNNFFFKKLADCSFFLHSVADSLIPSYFFFGITHLMSFIIIFREHTSAPGLSGVCACRSRPISIQNDVKLVIHSFVINFNIGGVLWILVLGLADLWGDLHCLGRRLEVLIRPMSDMGFLLWFVGGQLVFEFCHPANFAALLRLTQKMLRLTQGS
jgi:hypothetical protein